MLHFFLRISTLNESVVHQKWSYLIFSFAEKLVSLGHFFELVFSKSGERKGVMRGPEESDVDVMQEVCLGNS